MIPVGACRDAEPELFFTDEVTAKMVCKECPSKQACLDWALTHDEAGVWGGMTELERRRLKSGWKPRERLVTPPVSVGGHGIAGYRRGCRCDVCRAGNAEIQRRYKATVKPQSHCVECGATLSGRGRHKYCSMRCRRLFEAAS